LPLKASIEAKIKSKWASIHPLVGVASYCVDFAYLPKKGDCVVVELSPFLPITGPALFNWQHDEEQLRHGPLDFRINGQEHPHLDQLFSSNWEERW
jgi:hypothetical protein